MKIYYNFRYLYFGKCFCRKLSFVKKNTLINNKVMSNYITVANSSFYDNEEDEEKITAKKQAKGLIESFVELRFLSNTFYPLSETLYMISSPDKQKLKLNLTNAQEKMNSLLKEEVDSFCIFFFF
jgi:hypothetical protein